MGTKCYAVQCIVIEEENPEKCPFPVGFHHTAVGELSHDNKQHAQTFGKDCICGSGDILVDRQKHTHTHIIILCNHSHGRSNEYAV